MSRTLNRSFEEVDQEVRALQAEPSIGLLLSCNVAIRKTDAREMETIANEVSEKFSAALASLRAA